jgi:hypothetical protein
VSGRIGVGPREFRTTLNDAGAPLQQRKEFGSALLPVRDLPGKRPGPVVVPEAQGTLPHADPFVHEEVGDSGSFILPAAGGGCGFVGVKDRLQPLQLVLLESVEQVRRHDCNPPV